MAVEVESAAGRRLCVFCDGLCEGVAGLFKRIVAGDGLGVAVKKLALAVDVQPAVGFRMLVAVDAVGFALPRRPGLLLEELFRWGRTGGRARLVRA